MSRGRSGRLARASAALALVVCVTACGSGAGASASVSSTVKRYFAALADGDGHAACAQLTSGASAEIVRLAHQAAPQLGVSSCAEAIAKVSKLLNPTQRRELRSVSVVDVHIQGATAHARARAGRRTSRTYALSKRGQRWLLSGGFIP
jgi:ketosteroid isomerase-like protein